MNRKTLLMIYLFCAIIWSINAMISYASNGISFMFMLHLFCAVCWILASCITWKQMKNDNLN